MANGELDKKCTAMACTNKRRDKKCDLCNYARSHTRYSRDYCERPPHDSFCCCSCHRIYNRLVDKKRDDKNMMTTSPMKLTKASSLATFMASDANTLMKSAGRAPLTAHTGAPQKAQKSHHLSGHQICKKHLTK